MGIAWAKVLEPAEIEAIHTSTLDLLEHVGVLVREPRARTLLLDAGATAGPDADRILLPPSLVEEAVRGAPKRWTWHAREARHTFRVGDGGRTRLGPGSACTNFIDPDTGQCRAPTSKDADALVRLMDALEYVDIDYSPVTFRGDDLPVRYHDAARLVRDLTNTSKPPIGPTYDGAMAKDALEIASVLAGGREELRKRPMVAGYCDPISPLVQDTQMKEALLEYATMGQPVFIMCLDLAGASAPMPLAGTLLQQNAEILSALTIAHLANKEAPVIYGCVSGPLDMRSGTAALGGPEFGLLSLAAVQIAHRYGLPCSVGGQSDSKVHDAQASFEKGMSLLASVLAGADFVDLFFGSFEGFNTTSLEQVVIDHDLAGYAFRYREGIAVNDETLSLDLIRDVGPGGSFLRGRKALEHTRAWMSRETYAPGVVDRRSRPAWEKDGRRTVLERARERARAILSEHTPAPIDKDLVRRMDAIVERIRKECVAAA